MPECHPTSSRIKKDDLDKSKSLQEAIKVSSILDLAFYKITFTYYSSLRIIPDRKISITIKTKMVIYSPLITF